MGETSENLYFKHVTKLNDPDFKAAVVIDFGWPATLAEQSEGTFLKRIMKERLFSDILGLMFDASSFFFEVFNKEINYFVETGIIDHLFYRPYKDRTDIKRYEHLQPSGAVVLTMEHLEAGFVIWLFCVIFAIGVFFLELTKRHIDKFLQRKTLSTDDCEHSHIVTENYSN